MKGIWSGSIFEREIEGGNFAFLGQYKLVLNKGSKIVEYIKDMLMKGQTQKVCTEIKLLEDAYSGAMILEYKNIFKLFSVLESVYSFTVK